MTESGKTIHNHMEDEEVYIKLSPWMKGFLAGLTAGIIGGIIGIWIGIHFR